MQVTRDPVYGCALAHGKRDRFGYVHVGQSLAHHVAWIAARGPVPADREIDHLCRRPNCTALVHLEPVTRSENEHRKLWRYRVRIKSCPAGHALSEFGMVTPEGGRVCARCSFPERYEVAA